METALKSGGAERVYGIDLARAVAIIGMIIVNFEITLARSSDDPGWLRFLVSLIEGRAAATFVLLAGIGISLMAARSRLSGDPDARHMVRMNLLGRALFLFVTGMLFQIVWNGDILHYYAVYISICVFFIYVRTCWLWLFAVLLNLLFFGMFVFFEYDTGWDWNELDYVDFWSLRGFLRHLVFNGWHPVVPWLSFMLAGMCIGRLNLLDAKIRFRCMISGLLVGVVAVFVSWLYLNVLAGEPMSDAAEIAQSILVVECLPPGPLYMLQAIGWSVFIIMLCLEIGERFHQSKWIRPWLLLGQNALSIYLGHVIIGLGLSKLVLPEGSRNLVTAVLFGVAACGVSFWLTMLWCSRFKRGPLELAMRRVVNGKGSGPSVKVLLISTAVVISIVTLLLLSDPYSWWPEYV